jgi:hypothetical protein
MEAESDESVDWNILELAVATVTKYWSPEKSQMLWLPVERK